MLDWGLWSGLAPFDLLGELEQQSALDEPCRGCRFTGVQILSWGLLVCGEQVVKMFAIMEQFVGARQPP